MVFHEPAGIQSEKLRIESFSEVYYEQLRDRGLLNRVLKILGIPYHISIMGDIDNNAELFIDNKESAIRFCLLDENGIVWAVGVFSDIDFDKGSCSISYNCVCDQYQKYINSFVCSISDWVRNSAGWVIKNIENERNDLCSDVYNIPVNIPLYCVNRIVSEIEKRSIISFFDKYMFSPLSMNIDRENVIYRMVAASEMILAYNAQPLGFIAFYANNVQNKTAFISSIVVNSDCRGEGVGSSLICECKMISKLRGMEKLMLKVNKKNTRAISFYSRHGFVKTNDETENEYTMIMDL